MGNHTNIEKMSREALLADLTPEQREFLDKVRAGKKDPVFFAENLLGVKLHDGQKLWLWMTTRTQSEQAYDLGALLGTWKSRGEFDELLARNPDFSKNNFVYVYYTYNSLEARKNASKSSKVLIQGSS